MVFSSYLFVFLFLPVFLLVYTVSPRALRNLVILAASLYFYYIGEKGGLWILLAAIFGNYVFGYGIGRSRRLQEEGLSPWLSAKTLLLTGLGFNVAMLGYFKYAGFITQNLNQASAAMGGGNLVPVLNVALPLGVSFFVFQGISYLMDVYRGTIAATSSLVNFGTYKALFPQLIAGPIVRYKDVAKELVDRRMEVDAFHAGMTRFVIGFCKKVLLADTFAVTADAIFGLPAGELSAGTAWLGAICYALQIYFDFSAYSDMAIGMALMMGFKFPENFNYPYIATSVQDFWRRWHITLSSWFRDYVYISLGGNRRGASRTYINLFVVFALTGLWHGASWTFVVWGLWHGTFMVIERATRFDVLPLPGLVRRAYVLSVVLVGWVLFRATSFDHALGFFKAMGGMNETGNGIRELPEFYSHALGLAIAVGILGAAPAYSWLKAHLRGRAANAAWFAVGALLFAFAAMKALSGAYSPFLYFRF